MYPEIKEETTFKEIMLNIEAIKTQYKGVLASFSYKETKERNYYMRLMKLQIYSLRFERWKIDRLWEYMNDYCLLDVLKSIK